MMINRIITFFFVNDDTDLENEMDRILKVFHKNPAYFGDLFEKLRFLAEKTSIDLKRIYIKEKHKDTAPSNYFVQSNGIIGINKEAFSKVCLELSTLIEGVIYGFTGRINKLYWDYIK